jgi:hypothetical protein
MNAMLDELARNAGYGSYSDVPELIRNLPYDHVGSLLQPIPIKPNSPEFYYSFESLFEHRFGMKPSLNQIEDYKRRRVEANRVAKEREDLLRRMV